MKLDSRSISRVKTGVLIPTISPISSKILARITCISRISMEIKLSSKTIVLVLIILKKFI
jgi:hypothetical protein